MEKEQHLIDTFPQELNENQIHAEIFLNLLTDMVLNFSNKSLEDNYHAEKN